MKKKQASKAKRRENTYSSLVDDHLESEFFELTSGHEARYAGAHNDYLSLGHGCEREYFM